MPKTAQFSSQLNMIRSEIQCYRNYMIAGLNDDPLKWWSTREVQYVHLKDCQEVVLYACNECKVKKKSFPQQEMY